MERLELLLLLKADMLQGQTEFNQKSSGALQCGVPGEARQDGRAHFLACLRRAGLHHIIGLSSNRSSRLPPHLCPGVREKHSSGEGDAALREEKWEEKEGGGEVRQQWVEALSRASLSGSVRAGMAGDYLQLPKWEIHFLPTPLCCLPCYFQTTALSDTRQRAEIRGGKKGTC